MAKKVRGINTQVLTRFFTIQGGLAELLLAMALGPLSPSAAGNEYYALQGPLVTGLMAWSMGVANQPAPFSGLVPVGSTPGACILSWKVSCMRHPDLASSV